MKKIISKNLHNIVLSQDMENYFDLERSYDDSVNDSVNEMEDVEQSMEEALDEGLLTVTPESLEEMQQDEIEEDETINEDIEIEEPEGYPQFGTAFQAMRWAKHNNETVRINYRTLHGTNIVRDVEPHGDFHAKTTHRRNIAVWDQTVGGIRTYILENIMQDGNFPKGYKFTGEKFTPKFNFSRERKNLKRRLNRRKNRKLRNIV